MRNCRLSTSAREATNSGGLVRHKSKQVVTELTPVCWGQAGREELVAREEVAWELSYQTLTTWQKQTIAKIAINYSEQLSKAEA